MTKLNKLFQTKRSKLILAGVVIVLSLFTFSVAALEVVGPKDYRLSNALGFGQASSNSSSKDSSEAKDVTSVKECLEAGGSLIEHYPFPTECEIDGKIFIQGEEYDEDTVIPSPVKSIESLVADENYDVVMIEECDLAVRYPKIINNYPTAILDKTDEAPTEQRLLKNLMFFSDEDKTLGYEPMNSQFISCDNQEFDSFITEWETVSEFDDRVLEKQNLNQEEFCTQVKLNQASCGQIKSFSFYLNTGRGFSKNYFFATEGMIYNLATEDNSLFTELQFNSLAPSTPSVDLNGLGEVTEEVNTQGVAFNSYTNQYYPSLNIKYDDSWKFETKTTKHFSNDGKPGSTNLLDRNITISKGDTTIVIDLSPDIRTGCGPGDDVVQITDKVIINPSFDRFSYNGVNYYVPSQDVFYAECVVNYITPIKDNLDGEFYSGMFARVEGSQYLNEADQIIRQSSF
jgi:hypothetical protein